MQKARSTNDLDIPVDANAFSGPHAADDVSQATADLHCDCRLQCIGQLDDRPLISAARIGRACVPSVEAEEQTQETQRESGHGAANRLRTPSAVDPCTPAPD